MHSPQVTKGHPAFLKRNGGMLADLLERTLPPVDPPSSSLINELTIMVATGQVGPLVETRTRRAFARIFRATTPRQRTTWNAQDWRRRCAHLPGVHRSAPAKLARLHEILVRRHDFPSLRAMKAWGLPRWKRFYSDLGVHAGLASATTSLLLDREDMPGGPRTEKFYARLGLELDKDGCVSRTALFPRDVKRAKWKLQQIAAVQCTPELRPGPRACSGCPLQRLCQSYRTATAGDTTEKAGYIDIFAGGGGLSLGLTRAGYGLKLAIEKDRHAADTLYLNHPEAPNGVVDARDIRRILENRKLLARFKGTPIVAGGPPCQPFSMARRHSKADRKDPRRFLFRAFVRAVRTIRPRIVIMENVPGIQNAAGGSFKERIIREFSAIGYEMDSVLVNAMDYGVPQNRQRIFFIGLRRREYADPAATLRQIFARLARGKVKKRWKARDALSGLARFEAGEGGDVVTERAPGPLSAYARHLADEASGLTFNHETRPHNKLDIRIYRKLRHGETAASLEARHPGLVPYQVESFGDKYRKIHPGRPAPTIPAHLHRDSNSFVHFDIPRGITPREAARFQSFPDSYVFLGGFGPAFIQIGNAVPPRLAEAVGRAVRVALDSRRRRAPPAAHS